MVANPEGHHILGIEAKSINRRGAPSGKAVRFRLRRTAQWLLRSYWEHDSRPRNLDGQGQRLVYRTVTCGRSMQGNYVGVYRSAGTGRAWFTGLLTCCSGWICPVCCMPIAEGRRNELSAGLTWWILVMGGQAHLFTMTAPHTPDMELAEFLKRFDKARAGFNNSKTFKTIKEEAKRAGQVCSAETTYGLNGWHPHLHMIYFCKKLLTDLQQQELKSEWVTQLLKAGLGHRSQLTDMLDHALDIRGGKDAADYITKYGREETWGISSELTRQHTKESRGDHVTPFGLLALCADGELAPGGRDPGALFTEFAAATHGKRLMTWSPGLRKVLQLGQELTDQQLSEQLPQDSTKVGNLDAGQWKIVLQHRAEAELDDYVTRMCVDSDTGQRDIDDFVAYLGRRKPHGPNTVLSG